MPDLVQIVEEVAATKTPRELKRDNKIVAVLNAITYTAQNQYSRLACPCRGMERYSIR